MDLKPASWKNFMDYIISLDENLGCIVIKVFNAMTSEVSARSGPEIVRLSEEKHIKRFLFYVREAPNTQSDVQNYNFATEGISDFGFPHDSRSAFLVSPDDTSHDFITTLFLNAGYRVKSFTDEEAAKSWLMKV